MTVYLGGMPVQVDPNDKNFIFPDQPPFAKLGWVSDNFDGYLYKKDNVIWISDIRSKEEHKGHLVKLLDALIVTGHDIFIPTPSVRMTEICSKYGGFVTSDYEDVTGLYHRKAGKVFTSYYGNHRKFDKEYLKVRISNSAPEGWQFTVACTQLIPSWDHIVKPFKDGQFNEEVYNFKYWSQVKDKLEEVAAKLTLLCTRSGLNVVLLCHEKPDKFCHRHLAAEWLSKYLGYQIEELSI